MPGDIGEVDVLGRRLQVLVCLEELDLLVASEHLCDKVVHAVEWRFLFFHVVFRDGGIHHVAERLRVIVLVDDSLVFLIVVYRLAVDVVHLLRVEGHYIFYPEKAVRDRRAAEVFRPVGFRRVAHLLEKFDLRGVQRRGRVRQTADVQREIVVSLAVLGFLGAVERGVGLVHPLRDRAPLLHEIDV